MLPAALSDAPSANAVDLVYSFPSIVRFSIRTANLLALGLNCIARNSP